MARPIWGDGVPLGFDGPGKRARPILYDERAERASGSCLAIGDAGRTTAGLVVTQLLDEPGKRSFIVLDPGGRIAGITSKWRRKVCGGNNVKIINPYGVLTDKRPDLRSDQWNALNVLEPGAADYGDQCSALGGMVLGAGVGEYHPHFLDRAREAVTGGIYCLVKGADAKNLPRSLPTVLALFAATPEAVKEKIVGIISRCGDFDIKSSRLASFLGSAEELNTVLAVLRSRTGWMSRAIRDDMATAGGVDFRDCVRRPTTVYVIVPDVEVNGNGIAYLRLILSAALRALYSPEATVPTTVIVERAGALRYHARLEEALWVLGRYNSRATIMFDSFAQIKRLYPQSWEFFASGAVICLRPPDTETAAWVVRKIADLARTSSRRIAELDLLKMPPGRGLVFLPHAGSPRQSWIKRYYDIPRLSARADANPFYNSCSQSGWGMRVKMAVAAAAAGAIGGASLMLRGAARHAAPGKGARNFR